MQFRDRCVRQRALWSRISSRRPGTGPTGSRRRRGSPRSRPCRSPGEGNAVPFASLREANVREAILRRELAHWRGPHCLVQLLARKRYRIHGAILCAAAKRYLHGEESTEAEGLEKMEDRSYLLDSFDPIEELDQYLSPFWGHYDNLHFAQVLFQAAVSEWIDRKPWRAYVDEYRDVPRRVSSEDRFRSRRTASFVRRRRTPEKPSLPRTDSGS